MIIDSAKYTCPGGHEINEDSYLCRGDKGIFIVADGLGGHSSGEKASQAAIEYLEQNCTGGYTSERITALMEGANTQVLQYGDGGKTTVAAAFVENGNFIYANAGDSRVYYFRDGKIMTQTKDHSVCQASVDMGMMGPDDIRGSEDRSRLLKVLGGEENLAIKKHYPPIKVQNGDAFLVCSDGFWDYVYETEMEADLLKSASADVWLKYMLKRHILRAENKGDNYTAICGIIHTEDGDFSASTGAGVSASSKPASAVSGKKKFPLPIVLICTGAALLIAAAVVLCILFFGGNGNEEPDASDTPTETTDISVSETTPDTTPEESAADGTTTADTTTTTVTTAADTTTSAATTADTTTSAAATTADTTTAAAATTTEETAAETTTAYTTPAPTTTTEENAVTATESVGTGVTTDRGEPVPVGTTVGDVM